MNTLHVFTTKVWAIYIFVFISICVCEWEEIYLVCVVCVCECECVCIRVGKCVCVCVHVHCMCMYVCVSVLCVGMSTYMHVLHLQSFTSYMNIKHFQWKIRCTIHGAHIHVTLTLQIAYCGLALINSSLHKSPFKINFVLNGLNVSSVLKTTALQNNTV